MVKNVKKLFKIVEYSTYVEDCVFLTVFSKFQISKFYFLSSYESITFQPAGFLAFKEKSGSNFLIKTYFLKDLHFITLHKKKNGHMSQINQIFKKNSTFNNVKDYSKKILSKYLTELNII